MLTLVKVLNIFKINIKLLIFGLIVTNGFGAFSQTGGQYGYSFLNSPFNARTASLGGNQITVRDSDLNFALENPANLDSTNSTSMSWNHAILASGINKGSFAYAHHKKGIGTFSGYINYLAYGEMQRRDQVGNLLGTFKSSDMVFGAGYGRSLGKGFSVGANAKFILSDYDNNKSFGFATDIGATYYSEKTQLAVSALIKNIGFQFYHLQPNNQQLLPINIMTGISYKLAKAPFRFSLHIHDLQNWKLNNVTEADKAPVIDPISGDTSKAKGVGFGEELMRHMLFSIEVLMGKNIHLNFGFDYNKRKQLAIQTRPGLAGFSAGFGFNIRQISIGYGIQVYNMAGTVNYFSLSTNLNSWKKGSYNYPVKKEKKKNKKNKS
jgi:hypothetical protein